MAYLYGETDRKTRAALNRHLEACAECQKDMARWRRVMAELATWQLPDRSSGSGRLRRAAAWAAAAVLLLALGVGIGQAVRPAGNVAGLREQLRLDLAAHVQVDLASVRSQLREELRTELVEDFNELAAHTLAAAQAATGRALSGFAESLEALRTEDRQALIALLGQLESQRRSDYAALRSDLQRLATLAGEELMRTKQDMVWLAAWSQPELSVQGPPGD